MTVRLIHFSKADEAFFERISQVRQLRFDVWKSIVGDEIALQRFYDDGFDDHSHHVALLEGDEMLATARLTVCEAPAQIPDAESYQQMFKAMSFPLAILSRMVVRKDKQGLGYSTELTRQRISIACRFQLKEVWIESRRQRCRQLSEILGFEERGLSQDVSVEGEWLLLRKPCHEQAR